MKLSYFYVAADVPSGIIPESSVVIDVLRATTTIARALENGADWVALSFTRTAIDFSLVKSKIKEYPINMNN